jgi:hypothetical protein
LAAASISVGAPATSCRNIYYKNENFNTVTVPNPQQISFGDDIQYSAIVTVALVSILASNVNIVTGFYYATFLSFPAGSGRFRMALINYRGNNWAWAKTEAEDQGPTNIVELITDSSPINQINIQTFWKVERLGP